MPDALTTPWKPAIPAVARARAVRGAARDRRARHDRAGLGQASCGRRSEIGQFARRAGQAAGAAQVRRRGLAKGKPAVRRPQRHRAGQGAAAADVAGADLRAGRRGQGLVRRRRARCFAAGFRAGDIVHNSFAYHLTPGGFILEVGRCTRSAARSFRAASAIPSSSSRRSRTTSRPAMSARRIF